MAGCESSTGTQSNEDASVADGPAAAEATADGGNGGDAAAPLLPPGLEMPSGESCDPATQDCPSGEKCSSTRWDLMARWPEPQCILDLEGLGGEKMSPCLGAPGVLDGCGPGLSCFNVGTGEGYCASDCSRDDALCAPGEVCAPVDPDSSLRLCLPACDDDAGCVFEQFLVCNEREGVQFCDARHASPLD